MSRTTTPAVQPRKMPSDKRARLRVRHSSIDSHSGTLDRCFTKSIERNPMKAFAFADCSRTARGLLFRLTTRTYANERAPLTDPDSNRHAAKINSANGIVISPNIFEIPIKMQTDSPIRAPGINGPATRKIASLLIISRKHTGSRASVRRKRTGSGLAI